MKSELRSLLSILVILSLQSIGFSQTVGFSVTDNGQDVTNRPQQLYKINVVTGETNYIGDLLVDRRTCTNGLDCAHNTSIAPETGERVQREYEGLASIDDSLYGVPQFAQAGFGELCNTGQDPITGSSVDLRQFIYTHQQDIPSPGNPMPTPRGSIMEVDLNFPTLKETCIDFGRDSALGYNAQDGFFYSIASDDLVVPPGIRSKIYKIEPMTGEIIASANITNPAFSFGQPNGDENPYIDGFTILPNGLAYGTEIRFDVDPNAADADSCDAGGLYLISLTNGVAPAGTKCAQGSPVGMGTACLVKYLLPTTFQRNTGLANQQNGTLYMLQERGIIYRFTATPSCNVVQLNTLHTTGALSGAGGGAAGQRIEGCRGHVVLTSEFEVGADISVGGCSDFEGFDIPKFTRAAHPLDQCATH